MVRRLLVLGALLLLAGPVAADEPQLELLELELDGPRVVVSFELDRAFETDLMERLESGLPVTFVYQLRLVRDRRRWWDKRVRRTDLEVTATYDAVTHEYLVNVKQDGKLIDSRSVRSQEQVEVAMTRFQGFSAFVLEGLDPEARLRFKARADLGSGTFLWVIPTRETTDWVSSRDFHPPRGAGEP